MNRSSIILAAASLLLCAGVCSAQEYERIDGKWVLIAPPVPGTPLGDLRLIRQAVQNHADGPAVTAAKAFLKKYPGDAGQEEVMMLAAQAEIHHGRLWQAFNDWTEKQLTQYPAGKFSQRVLQWEYDIGDAFLNGKKRVALGIFLLPAEPEGLQILHRVVEHAPGSALGDRSMLRIAGYHFNHRNWTEAIQAYDEYVKLFRNAQNVPYATLQAARASFLAYRGAEFDDAPLLDAEQRFKIFREHYPAQAAKADVNQILTNIRDLKAQKLLTTAEFYRRTGRPQAQALYYRQVLDLYPQSPSATQAHQRLAKLGDLSPASAPAPQPQTHPFTPPPEDKPPQPTTTQAATGPATRSTTPTATTTASSPSTAPIRIEDLLPTTQGTATHPATRPWPTTQPASDAATLPTTTPTTGGSK
jgi:outer membrane protein assembly factor BamD (BamD/ComL family)